MIFKIYYSPKSRFQELSLKPLWSLPLILSLVVPLFIGTFSITLLPRQVLIDSTEKRIERVKNYIDEQIAKGRMPSEQRANTMERIEQTARQEIENYEQSSKPAIFLRFLLRSLPALVWSAIQLLIFTALLNLLLPLLGANSSYERMLTITANSALVRIGGAIFHSGLQFATGKLTVNTSFSLFAPPALPVFIRGFLASVEIFTLWELILISLGMQVFFNLPAKRSATAVFGIWLVYILLLAFLTSLSGGLALPD